MAELFGHDGLLVVTYSQQGREPSQGIISLRGESLTEALTNYFHQSEQILTFLTITTDISKPFAAGLILQALPPKDDKITPSELKELWPQVVTAARAVKYDTLLDPFLPLTTILWDSFKDFEPSILHTTNIRHACECTRARAEAALTLLTPEEKQEFAQDDSIEITCEFCNKKEVFSAG